MKMLPLTAFLSLWSSVALLLAGSTSAQDVNRFYEPDHPWMPPSDDQQRSPSALINTLANHGYIDRSGFNIDLFGMATQMEAIFNLDPEYVFLSHVVPAISCGITSENDAGELFLDLGSMFGCDEFQSFLVRSDSNPFVVDPLLLDSLMTSGQNASASILTFRDLMDYQFDRISQVQRSSSNITLTTEFLAQNLLLLPLIGNDPALKTVSKDRLAKLLYRERFPDRFLPGTLREGMPFHFMDPSDPAFVLLEEAFLNVQAAVNGNTTIGDSILPPGGADGIPPPGFEGPPPGFDGPPPGFEGPPPGFDFDGPPPGFDGPPPGFDFDGPPPDFDFDGPPPSFDLDGPPPDFDFEPPPEFDEPPPDFDFTFPPTFDANITDAPTTSGTSSPSSEVPSSLEPTLSDTEPPSFQGNTYAPTPVHSIESNLTTSPTSSGASSEEDFETAVPSVTLSSTNAPFVDDDGTNEDDPSERPSTAPTLKLPLTEHPSIPTAQAPVESYHYPTVSPTNDQPDPVATREPTMFPTTESTFDAAPSTLLSTTEELEISSADGKTREPTSNPAVMPSSLTTSSADQEDWNIAAEDTPEQTEMGASEEASEEDKAEESDKDLPSFEENAESIESPSIDDFEEDRAEGADKDLPSFEENDEVIESPSIEASEEEEAEKG